ncbi:MAG TPA: NYN domain-containing protein [Gemmatimonadales bacterium]|nr:NYN domain-containing protein [Gemmatimonadales bacterium]
MTPQQHNHLPRPVHKEPPPHAPNAALLIDFDNVTMGIRSDLQSELKRLLQSEIIRGKVAVQRAYADWRRYPQYIVPLSESSIDLIFAPAYGSNKKNATDIRLAIDALELVFTRPEIGTFILLSGDSDFSSLVLKLKEYGKYVIGVGIRESSSDLLIQNCDEYYSYNELAGFTKESEVEYIRRDPWELVVEAVKQMTAHNDVMRSDRLKQVMQEIDPNFDEKDAGFSRFSKFVVEAAHRGLITLTRLDNGQYEIALGPQVVGALAQPALGALPTAVPERAPREGGRGRRGGRGGRGRGEDKPAEPAAPAAETENKTSFSFGSAFGLLKQAIGGKSPDEVPESVEEIETHAPPPAPEPAMTEEDDIPMPASSAPPPPYSAPPGSPGGMPARSARFRRGSRGGRVAPPKTDVPKIGVVEVDPNFRPRIDLVPPTRPPVAPISPESPSGESRRGGGEGGRGRGGRGGGRSAGGEREDRGERGERGGRNRRGGRGRARGGRGGSGGGREHEERPAARFEAPAPAAPPAPPPPPPSSRPKAPEPEADGESFWSKVKRGLTGGA